MTSDVILSGKLNYAMNMKSRMIKIFVRGGIEEVVGLLKASDSGAFSREIDLLYSTIQITTPQKIRFGEG